MSARVQAHPKNTKHSVIHQVLIKLLIMEDLKKTQRTWKRLLDGFKGEIHEPQEKKADTPMVYELYILEQYKFTVIA